ncbi:hypothetical protein C361_00599 [Cryptococcus neoformans Tu259-1]|uniref:Uncharacterized protein n=2 Tax=Cryptococcus neoformans TaxID=5207 RepID=A0A854QLK0_CRYNE|nr:hypothetical protein C361_00599 [Cryptococcus neoformans var. grubii Tu259-1]OXG88618.1 hypothetical protein C350_00593 [Cryptococcus neoformans var. grubii MW-RSA36]OXL11075.1 hypothetical protein C348_00593 [Cryptococcus neoformans var. grubii Gb118]
MKFRQMKKKTCTYHLSSRLKKMPLYKLTEKRLKKRQREDETGITELKAKMRAMGEEVGDSEDEMDSESDDSEEESEDDEEESGEDAAGETSGSDEEEVEEEGEDESGSDKDEDEDGPIPMTPSEALTVPIYTAISIPTDSGSEAEDESEDGTGPKINLCILCPGKILKNEHMVKVHLDSNAHKRAAKRYSSYLSANPPRETDDPRKIARSLVPSAPAPALKSNNAKPATTETKEDRNGEKEKKPSKKAINATSRKNRKQARIQAEVEERLTKGEIDPKNGKGMEGMNRKMKRELFRRLKEKEEGDGHKGKKQKN